MQRMRAMENRHQRRSLPPTFHIRGPEIVDHRNAKRRAQALPVAQLHCKPPLRPVKDSLPVKSHHANTGKRDPIHPGKRPDTFSMFRREHAFR